MANNRILIQVPPARATNQGRVLQLSRINRISNTQYPSVPPQSASFHKEQQNVGPSRKRLLSPSPEKETVINRSPGKRQIKRRNFYE